MYRNDVYSNEQSLLVLCTRSLLQLARLYFVFSLTGGMGAGIVITGCYFCPLCAHTKQCSSAGIIGALPLESEMTTKSAMSLHAFAMDIFKSRFLFLCPHPLHGEVPKCFRIHLYSLQFCLHATPLLLSSSHMLLAGWFYRYSNAGQLCSLQ